MYKTLLQGGHFSQATKSIDMSERWNPTAFATSFLDHVDGDVVVGMCSRGQRNGAFLVAELCQALLGGGDKESKDGRAKLKQWFTSSILKTIESGDAKGKQVLLDKLGQL